MKLPKDLEAKRKDHYDEISDPRKAASRAEIFGYVHGFDAGATAVLQHEQIKKLEEALNKIILNETKNPAAIHATAVHALADFRAWVSSADSKKNGDGK